MAKLRRCLCPEHEGPNPLAVSEFSSQPGGRDGLRARCKTCINRQAARYRVANPETVSESNRRWAQANPGKILAKSLRKYKRDPGAQHVRQRRQWARVQAQVLDHYGWICACCGVTENLTIDHVNGDGSVHRVGLFGRYGTSLEFYKWLIQEGFPEGFQTLCRPCNCSKQGTTACRLVHSQ